MPCSRLLVTVRSPGAAVGDQPAGLAAVMAGRGGPGTNASNWDALDGFRAEGQRKPR
jgi:hypothetical protein